MQKMLNKNCLLYGPIFICSQSSKFQKQSQLTPLFHIGSDETIQKTPVDQVQLNAKKSFQALSLFALLRMRAWVTAFP